jgi:hypothetical protein
MDLGNVKKQPTPPSSSPESASGNLKHLPGRHKPFEMERA